MSLWTPADNIVNTKALKIVRKYLEMTRTEQFSFKNFDIAWEEFDNCAKTVAGSPEKSYWTRMLWILVKVTSLELKNTRPVPLKLVVVFDYAVMK